MIEIGGSEIPPHSAQDVVLEVRPISLGMAVTMRPVEKLDTSWAGVLWNAWVSDENKVTIRIANVTDQAVTPAVRKFTAN